MCMFQHIFMAHEVMPSAEAMAVRMVSTTCAHSFQSVFLVLMLYYIVECFACCHDAEAIEHVGELLVWEEVDHLLAH